MLERRSHCVFILFVSHFAGFRGGLSRTRGLDFRLDGHQAS